MSKLKGKARANARKKAFKQKTNFTPRVNIITPRFTAICHDLFHTMYEDKTIDFSKAPYMIELSGPSFHEGEAVDITNRRTITCITPGQENDPRLDPIQLHVKKGSVEWMTRHQTYVMNVKETA